MQTMKKICAQNVGAYMKRLKTEILYLCCEFFLRPAGIFQKLMGRSNEQHYRTWRRVYNSTKSNDVFLDGK